MRIGYQWLDEGESQNYSDIFDEQMFFDGITQHPIEHDVLSPSGDLYAIAKCLLTVEANRVQLDYSAFKRHNEAKGILLGVTTFNYDKTITPKIFDVAWQSRGSEMAHSCSVKYFIHNGELDGEQDTFMELVEYARALDFNELKELLPPSGYVPAKRAVSKTSFLRNPYVVAFALLEANGICGKCGECAPFIAKSSGKPYLEVHHVIPLSKGGTDDIENTVAVCPNCHREAHYGLKC